MNVCIFSGRITRDAETKQVREDLSITSFSIAVDSGYGERKRTDFINVKAFKKDALAPHLLKGKAVAVHGEYQEEKWEKDGEKKSRVVILANHIEFQQGTTGQGQPAPTATTGRQDMNEMDACPF